MESSIFSLISFQVPSFTLTFLISLKFFILFDFIVLVGKLTSGYHENKTDLGSTSSNYYYINYFYRYRLSIVKFG